MSALQTFNTLWENKHNEIRSTSYSSVHVTPEKLAKDRLLSAELGSAENEGLIKPCSVCGLASSVLWHGNIYSCPARVA